MAMHSSILAGKSHGQRRLASYSPWVGCKESNTAEQLTRTQQYCQKRVNSNPPIHPPVLPLVSIHLFSSSVSLFLLCNESI